MKHLLIVIAISVFAFSASADTTCRPTIGVSGQSPSSRTVVPLISVLHSLGANTIYLDWTQARDPNIDIPALDGLILAGNSEDIDSARYGEPLDPRTNKEQSSKRGIYEYAAIELALNKQIPLLGICGGMQRLTVSGEPEERGSLIQHVDDQNQGKYTVPVPPYIPTDTINVEEGTILSTILNQKDTSMKVNSYHHQVPKTLRDGFRVSAMSDHGTIEAIEPDPTGAYGNQFALGVMWHPEFMGDALSQALMQRFVSEATQRACGDD